MLANIRTIFPPPEPATAPAEEGGGAPDLPGPPGPLRHQDHQGLHRHREAGGAEDSQGAGADWPAQGLQLPGIPPASGHQDLLFQVRRILNLDQNQPVYCQDLKLKASFRLSPM